MKQNYQHICTLKDKDIHTDNKKWMFISYFDKGWNTFEFVDTVSLNSINDAAEII